MTIRAYLKRTRRYSKNHKLTPIKASFVILLTTLLFNACAVLSSDYLQDQNSPPQPAAQSQPIGGAAIATQDARGLSPLAPGEIHFPGRIPAVDLTALPVSSQATQAPQQEAVSQFVPTEQAASIKSSSGSLSGVIPTSTIDYSLASDLLFIEQERLMRWDYVTNYTTPLAEGVTSFSPNAAGNQIVLLRHRKITANGVALFDLDLLNFESMQITHLSEQVPQLHNLIFSPDGTYIAYTSEENRGSVYALRAESPDHPINLGSCQPINDSQCQHLVWSLDSHSLAWSDKHGVWVYSPEKNQANLAHSDSLQVTDPLGKSTTINVWFDILSWSPNGRYLLSQITPVDSGVRWLGIIDVLTGRLAEVPDSFEYAGSIASAEWASNGSLIVISNTSQDTNAGIRSPMQLRFTQWQLVPTNPRMLYLEKQLLFETEYPAGANSIDPEDRPRPAWLSQKGSELYFGITMPNETIPPLLLIFNLEKGTLLQRLEIPANIIDVLWSPDGHGALLLDSKHQATFIPVQNNSQADQHPIQTINAHSFKWLPPTLHTLLSAP